jgi:hypothetical protein
LFLTSFSIGILSGMGWKFERVLVAFVPLIALSGCFVTATAIAALSERRNARWRLATAWAAALVALAGVYAMRGTSKAIQTESMDYDRFTNVLASVVRTDLVGYVGNGPFFYRARSFVEAAGKRMVTPAPVEELAQDPVALERGLREREIEFVIVDFERPSRFRNDAFWETKFTYSTFDQVYENRSGLLLWRLVERSPDSIVAALLSNASIGGLVAVLGNAEELGSVNARWVRDLLADAGLRAYWLPLQKMPEVLLSAASARGIRHVMLVPSEGSERRIEAFRRLLRESGGKLLAGDAVAEAELWTLPPDRTNSGR